MKLLRCVLAAMALVGSLQITTAAAADASKGGNKDLVLRGDARCTECHDEADNPSLLSIGKTRHGVRADKRTPECSSCHGESNAHVTYKGSEKPPKPDRTFGKHTATSAEERSGACMNCHKGGNRMHWSGSAHESGEVACSSCHQIHGPRDRVRDKQTQAEVCYTCHKEQRVELRKASHHPVNEGKVVCSGCHNLHGSTAPKLLVKNTVNETCYSCHTEKRGPFLWEHPPASDNCTNCHVPHGSNNNALLRTRMPYLCEQCHDYTNHPGNVYSGRSLPASQGGAAANAAGNSGAQQVLLRACANCHTQVHGTNHPSGPRFTR